MPGLDLRLRRDLIHEVEAVLERFDVLFTATTPIPPPPIAGASLESILASRGITTAFNTTSAPASSRHSRTWRR